jgi:hypothetical protein
MKTTPLNQIQDLLNRRIFLGKGAAALGSLAIPFIAKASNLNSPNYSPKAKRIIYLFQSGAPSQMDLFDPKPTMKARFGENLPDSRDSGSPP